MHRFYRQRFTANQGYALPLATLFSLVAMTWMTTVLLQSQNLRKSSEVRQTSVVSEIVSDSAIARVLTELSKPQNSELLVRNYDPINLATGRNYLGEDGVLHTDDEQKQPVDQWSNYDPSGKSCYQAQNRPAPDIQTTGTIGSDGEYRILAYRYNGATKTGNALVEGRSQGITSHLLVSISVESDFANFPGIGLIRPALGQKTGVLALRGRDLIGKNGNVYFVSSDAEPNLTGSAGPDDPNRDQFLSAIWSSASDGATRDNVSGRITACDLKIQIPDGIKGTNFKVIDKSKTLEGLSHEVPTSYQLEKIDLDKNDVLKIDTTRGVVKIDMIDPGGMASEVISLKDQSQILNVRTDGRPPRVGDVRINIRFDGHVGLYDRSCIQNVFLYIPYDELQLMTSGPGCPSNLNTNFEGVAWVEALLSSKNNVANRNVHYRNVTDRSFDQDASVTPDVTSGMAVPDDVSSLTDLLSHTQLPRLYRYGDVKGWRTVSLEPGERRGDFP